MCVFSSLFNFGRVGNKERLNIGHAFYIKHLSGFVISNQGFKDCYVRGGIKKIDSSARFYTICMTDFVYMKI